MTNMQTLSTKEHSEVKLITSMWGRILCFFKWPTYSRREKICTATDQSTWPDRTTPLQSVWSMALSDGWVWATYLFSDQHIRKSVSQTDKCTSSFCCLIVSLAHQFLVIHKIELISSGKLALANEAGKALKVVDIVLCPSNHLSRWNGLVAASTLGPKPPSNTAG